MAREPRMIQSIDRAIRILNLLQGARRMTLSEIATQLDLPPSTVHGILKTLAVHGMVGQEADGRSLPARADRAAARQRVPRDARAARPRAGLVARTSPNAPASPYGPACCRSATW